jgi:hypothetical protein
MGKDALMVFMHPRGLGPYIASAREEEALLWRRGFDITVGNVCNTHVK